MNLRSERALKAAVGLLAFLWLSHAWPDPGPREAPQQPPGEGAARLLWGESLDPNQAPSAALEVLPRIGTTRAAAIVSGRPYCEAAEVQRVRGIGPVTWAGIRGSLEVRELPKECKAEAPRSDVDG
jgi:DNA uptake protein ComE-like DNA-binding protein